MKFAQGAFSFLPDLSQDQIRRQIQYCLRNGWAIHLEHTDDPSPDNLFWQRWGVPLFDSGDPEVVLHDIAECRRTHPAHYIRLMAYDAEPGAKTPRLSFIVNRPPAR